VCSILQEYFIEVTAFIKKYSIGEIDIQSKGENAIYTDDVIFYIYEKALNVLGEDLLIEIKESSTINEYIQYKKERNERKISQQFLTLVQDPYNSSVSTGSYDDNYIENNITPIGEKKSSTQNHRGSYRSESSLFHSYDTSSSSLLLSNESVNSSSKFSSTRGSLTNIKELPTEDEFAQETAEKTNRNSLKHNDSSSSISKYEIRKSLYGNSVGGYENKPVQSIKKELTVNSDLQQFSMLSPESPITLSASISCPNISKKVYNSSSQSDNMKISGIPNSNSSSLISLQPSNNETPKDSSFIPNSFTNKSDRFQRFFKPKMNVLSEKL
ncbi:hypothetical protein PIROE2DRAFT_8424, partial [Piromyces sp. E2]